MNMLGGLYGAVKNLRGIAGGGETRAAGKGRGVAEGIVKGSRRSESTRSFNTRG